MYARVTKALAWILPIIQSGECGKYKDAALRKGERIKKAKKKSKTMDNRAGGAIGLIKPVIAKKKNRKPA